MKKIIKLFLFALVLFGLGFSKAYASETIKVTFKNVNPLDSSATHEESGFGTRTVAYNKIFSKEVYVDDIYIYTFNGFKTSDGTVIDGTYSYTTPNLTVTDTRVYNTSNNTLNLISSKIKLAFVASSDVDGESNVDIYVDWSKIKRPTLTVNLWDVKDGQTKYIVKTEKILIDPEVSSNKQRPLDQIFTAMSGRPYTGIRVGEKTEEDVKGLNTYTFTGWFADANCTEEITSSYTPSGDTAKVLKTLKTSGTKIIFAENNKITQDATVNIYGHFSTKTAPQLIFKYIDKVGNGTGSWSNVESATAYEHTFVTPADVPTNYKFLYWKIDETIYNAGQKFTYDFTNKPDGNVDKITANAWYQPGIKVNYFKEKGSTSDANVFQRGEWSFEDVQMISEKPTKPGYRFVAWVDKDGNEVTDTTFEVPDITTEPGQAVEINLFAEYEKVKTTVKVEKIWNDSDDTHRPESITFDIKLGEDTVTTVTLNEENDWSLDVVLDRYDEEGNELQYTVEEKEVKYYTSEVSPTTSNNAEATEDSEQTITVTNTIKDDGKVNVKHVEKETGEVIETETITDVIDSDYETSPNSYDDYEYLNEYEGEATGVITEEEKTVIYYYKALIGTVTVYYVDIDTGDILATEVLTGRYKLEWFADTSRTFEGYEFVDIIGDESGVFGPDAIEVTLYYTQNTGDEGEPEDDVITPPHTDCDVEFNISTQQLYLDDRKYKKNKDFK